ncbi:MULTISPECIES: hypothetical protein [unclassified Rickettsia]
MVKPALLHGSKKVPCHSRENGNLENHSHPEFISGSFSIDAEQVQHDKD